MLLKNPCLLGGGCDCFSIERCTVKSRDDRCLAVFECRDNDKSKRCFKVKACKAVKLEETVSPRPKLSP